MSDTVAIGIKLGPIVKQHLNIDPKMKSTTFKQNYNSCFLILGQLKTKSNITCFSFNK